MVFRWKRYIIIKGTLRTVRKGRGRWELERIEGVESEKSFMYTGVARKIGSNFNFKFR
jgi:hypothetical protein